MRTLFIILALLIAGSTYAGFGEGEPSKYSGCKNYGVNSSISFADMISVMNRFSGDSSDDTSTTKKSGNTDIH